MFLFLRVLRELSILQNVSEAQYFKYNLTRITSDTVHTTHFCHPFSSELQNLISDNERRMADLKQISIQLQQKCSEPCRDTVEIQPITGTGNKKKRRRKEKKIRKRTLTYAPPSTPPPTHRHTLWPAGQVYFTRCFSIQLHLGKKKKSFVLIQLHIKINMLHQGRVNILMI